MTYVNCSQCSGSGKVRGRWYIFKVMCPNCHGSGHVRNWTPDLLPDLKVTLSSAKPTRDNTTIHVDANPVPGERWSEVAPTLYLPQDFGSFTPDPPTYDPSPSFDPGGGSDGGAGASGSWDPPADSGSFNN